MLASSFCISLIYIWDNQTWCIYSKRYLYNFFLVHCKFVWPIIGFQGVPELLLKKNDPYISPACVNLMSQFYNVALGPFLGQCPPPRSIRSSCLCQVEASMV